MENAEPKPVKTKEERLACLRAASENVINLQALHKRAAELMEELRLALDMEAQYLELGIDKADVAGWISAEHAIGKCYHNDPKFKHLRQNIPLVIWKSFDRKYFCYIGVHLKDGGCLAFTQPVWKRGCVPPKAEPAKAEQSDGPGSKSLTDLVKEVAV